RNRLVHRTDHTIDPAVLRHELRRCGGTEQYGEQQQYETLAHESLHGCRCCTKTSFRVLQPAGYDCAAIPCAVLPPPSAAQGNRVNRICDGRASPFVTGFPAPAHPEHRRVWSVCDGTFQCTRLRHF